MTEPEQTNGTGLVKKWGPLLAAVGVFGGGGTFAGNLLGNKGVEEVKASVVAAQKHCDDARGVLVKELDAKALDVDRRIAVVTKDQREAYKAFVEVTGTLKLTVARLHDLRVFVTREPGAGKPK